MKLTTYENGDVGLRLTQEESNALRHYLCMTDLDPETGCAKCDALRGYYFWMAAAAHSALHGQTAGVSRRVAAAHRRLADFHAEQCTCEMDKRPMTEAEQVDETMGRC